MPTGNITQAEGILKISTGQYTREYETTAMVFNRVNKGGGNPLSDRGFEIPTEIEGNWTHTWMTDGGAYPAGGSITTIRPTVYFKEYVHAMRLTVRAIETIKPGKAAVASWLDKNVTGAVDAGYKMNNRYCWGTGNGVLGVISTGANSTTQTLSNNQNVRYLGYGMRVSVYDSTLSVLRGSATITSTPTPGQTTITLSAAINSTTGDYVTIFGGANNAITGLKAIIDDTTEAGVMFQSISRNDYYNYRAQVIDANGDGLDVELLNQMVGGKIQVAMGGISRSDYELWSYTSQTAAYASLGYNLKRYEGKSKSLDLGFTSFDWQGMPWITDVDCDKDRVYYINWASIEKFVAKSWGWMDVDGRILRLVPSSTSGSAYDAMAEGYWNCDWNLGAVKDVRGNGKIIDLAIPANY